MIHVQKTANIVKILAEDNLEDKKEKDAFLNVINDVNETRSYEITFIEIKSLPLEVIKAMLKIKERISLEVTQKSLWIYLLNFGFKNSYNKILTKKNAIEFHAIENIAIGGSFGSIEGVLSIVKSLPYVNISVFITIHLLEDKESHLAQILQKETEYKVYEAQENMRIEKNSIYISPPNYHAEVINGRICLNQNDSVNFSRPSIDVNFESLSLYYKDRLLVILLCGYGSDGTHSLKDLEKNRTSILIQNPNECEAQDIPLHAIIAKVKSKVLCLEKIVEYIGALFSTQVDIRDEIDGFIENIYKIYEYDFRSYDKNILQRRVSFTMETLGISTFQVFKQAVFEDEKIFERLIKEFSINVTNFYRDPETYKLLRTQVITQLDSYPSIRIWCAGCSRGDEPYSVAMMLDEAGLLHKTQIYATDFNTTILNQAENGLYTKKEYDKFEVQYHKSGGKQEFKKWFHLEDDFVEIKKHIKDKILFFKHNLVTDSSINEFNIVFCRNVLIYFDNSLKKRVFKTIDKSLSRNGFLVLGSSETDNKRYEYKRVGEQKYKVYQKV